MSANKPCTRVGIVICTYEAFDIAEACVRSAAKTPDAAIFVCDDHSPTWPGEDVVRSWAPNIKGVYHFRSREGLTRSWNHGAMACQKRKIPYLVMANADLLFPESWWWPMESALEKYSAVGPMTNAPGHSYRQAIEKEMPNYQLSDHPKQLQETIAYLQGLRLEPIEMPMLNGFCFAVRTRDLFHKYRHDKWPFNPAIPMDGNEDDFFGRVRRRGGKLGLARGSFVFHYRSVSRGLKKKKRALAKSYRGAYRKENEPK